MHDYDIESNLFGFLDIFGHLSSFYFWIIKKSPNEIRIVKPPSIEVQ